MTIAEILQNSHISPLDREILLSYVLQKPKEHLFAHPEKKLTKNQIAKFISLAKRRAKGEPIAYLVGKKEFYGLEFIVNRNVLIPRPETEMLVDKCLDIILDTKYSIPDAKIIDIGTGSGNIAISIAKNIPQRIQKKINFYATDISKKALNVAKKNAKRHKIDKSIKFIKSDLLEFAFQKKLEGNVIIIANPPYVSGKLYQKRKNSLKYEPKSALLSQKEGLVHYEKLLKQIKKSLFTDRCSLIIILEFSPEQKSRISRLVKKELPAAKIDFFKDLAGKWRALKINL